MAYLPLLLGLLSLAPIVYTACVPSGDETTINELLVRGGANTVVSLCANAVFNLKQPVIFTAPNQELSTEGYPTDSTRAVLIVTGVNQTAAIIGNCHGCSDLKLRNIQVNGNRPALGGFSGSGNIEIGHVCISQKVAQMDARMQQSLIMTSAHRVILLAIGPMAYPWHAQEV
jgi:hypothetical protein